MDIKRPPEIREHLTYGGCFFEILSVQLVGLGIGLAEGIYGNAFHYLVLQRTITVISRGICNLIYHIHALNDLTESGIRAIQVRTGFVHDEELAACGIGMHSSCHRQNAFGMFQIIGHTVGSELTLDAVAGAAHTGAIGTSALDHETADDTVEDQTIIEMLADQADKIVNGFRCNFGIKLAFDHTAILHGNSNNRILCHNNFLSFLTEIE